MARLGRAQPKRAFITRAALAVTEPEIQIGLTAAAPATTAVGKKVAVQSGVCAMAPAGTGLETTQITAGPPVKPVISQSAQPVAANRYSKPTATLISRAPAAPPAVNAETGTSAAAATATSIAVKVAVQSGACAAGAFGASVSQKVATAAATSTAAAATTAVDKKVAVLTGASTAAAAVTGVDSTSLTPVVKPTAPIVVSQPSQALAQRARSKRPFITRSAVEVADAKVQTGATASAVTATATEQKIAAQQGVCTVAFAPTGLEVSGALPPGRPFIPAVVNQSAIAVARRTRNTNPPIFIDYGTQLDEAGPEVQIGSTAAAVAVTAVEKKVAVQGGNCAVSLVGASSDKKVATDRGTSAAAVAATGLSGQTPAAAERGTTTTAPATTSTEKKVAIQSGFGSVAATGGSVARKVGAERGTSALGTVPATGINTKVAIQRGTNTAGFAATRFGGNSRVQSGTCTFGVIATSTQRRIGTTAGSTTVAASVRSNTKKLTTQTGRSCTATAAAGVAVKRVTHTGYGTAGFALTSKIQKLGDGNITGGRRTAADNYGGRRTTPDIYGGQRTSLAELTGGPR